jgi:hypothetical protein
VLRLLAWTAVIVALLLLPVSRKLARQREHEVAANTFGAAIPHLARHS